MACFRVEGSASSLLNCPAQYELVNRVRTAVPVWTEETMIHCEVSSTYVLAF